jgi:WD40 repeat protein
LQHGDGVLYAAFSPDSETVITASEDFSAVLWKAASGERISGKLVHQEKVRYAAFARTLPWVVTASDDGTAIIWDRKTGDQLTPPFRHSKGLVRAEFNDDQTALITTDEEENRWKWNLAIDRRPLRELADQISSLTGEAPFRH